VVLRELSNFHSLLGQRAGEVNEGGSDMKFCVKPLMAAMLGLSVAAGAVHSTRASAERKTDKVQICHGTASEKNPYVLISIDPSAVKAHLDGTAPGHTTHGKNNHPDFLSEDGTCPTPPPTCGCPGS
jgi:hypothetical protein